MPDLDKNYYLDREGLNTLIREFEANIIAYEYDPTVTYSKLDYCIHDNKLYQCFTAITTPKPWDEDDWDVIAIGDVLNKVRQENLTDAGIRPVLLGRSSTNPRLITTYKSDRLTFSNGDDDTPGLLTVYGRGRFIDEATYTIMNINSPAGEISGVSNISTYQINGVVVGNNPEFTDTTYTFAGGTNSFTVTPEGGTAQTVSVTPSIANNITGSGTSGKVAAFTGANTIGDGYSVDTTVTSGSGNLVTSGAVYTAIDNLPEPMVFKGTLGTGGTITTLPTAASSNEGFTYKVITAGTYASQSAKVGDVFVSNGTEWVLIPAGDTDSDTWRNIKINGTEQISSAISSGAVDFVNGTAITAGFNSTGNKVSFSHNTSGVTAGTYKSVTVDAQGHVTAGTNPTTLSGYGITDANIASGVITLGSNTITPLTASSTLDATKLSGTIPSGCYTNTTYTFANGTNGFTVTPSGGTAQTVTVTPSIANNITGSGTSGYLTKFNGTNTITNGPQLGSSTTTYLNNAGSWATPPDTKNTTGSTDTSSKIYLIGALEQSANPQTYSDNEVYVTNGTLTAGNAQATILGVVPTNGTSGGVSLYGGTGAVDNYGVAFRTTANKGKHGDIQGDWATYFTMNDADNRGWIFRRNGGAGNVASVSTKGNAVFNGSVTVGGNTTNTTGCSMQFNSTTQSLDFVFK